MSLVLTHARVMTCDGPLETASLRLLDHGAIVCDDEHVTWVGSEADLPRTAAPHLDLGGRLVTPGLVDCHTHLPFAGDRAAEFAQRARGASYLDIAAAGGGIAATLGPTRAASVDELAARIADRADRALATGTTTMEAKSGYDLTLDGEVRLLEAIHLARGRTPVSLMPTLLAHVVPPEARGCRADRDAYVDAFAGALIPRVAAAHLAGAFDVYLDEGAFTLEESRRLLVAAKASDLDLRAHVGQLADLGGAELLAELGARSVDHLEQVSGAGIDALAAAGAAAVMLPGACVQLRLTPPPVERLRQAGVVMAVATDLNPGTSYSESLPIQMWLATTHYGMTVDEAWLGVTRAAAHVLDRPDLGVLRAGARADLVVWDTDEPAEIPYRYGANLVHSVYVASQRVR